MILVRSGHYALKILRLSVWWADWRAGERARERTEWMGRLAGERASGRAGERVDWVDGRVGGRAGERARGWTGWMGGWADEQASGRTGEGMDRNHMACC